MAPTLRSAAVLATAGLLLAGGAAPAVAATTTRAATSLSVRSVHHASSATVSGVLLRGRTPVSGALVALAAEPAGADHFTTVQTVRTGAKGGASFVVTPAVRTRYALVYAGSATDRASRSGVVTVAAPARTAASSLSIRLAPSSIDKGQRSTVSGILQVGSTPLAGRHVVLLGRARPADSWTRQTTRTTGPKGFVSFVVSPAADRQFQLAFAGDAVGRASRSGVVTLLVRRTTSLSIRAGASSLNPGASTTVSGTLLAGRTQIAGHTVRLLARPEGTGAYAEVARATTGDHGFVSFTVTPTRSTQYELVSVRSARYAASHSGVVTVLVRKATALSVSSAGSSLTGVLTSSGTGVAGRTVVLQSQPADASTPFADVRTATTDATGGVAFTVSPTTATAYRLVFRTHPRYLASMSSTVVLGTA